MKAPFACEDIASAADPGASDDEMGQASLDGEPWNSEDEREFPWDAEDERKFQSGVKDEPAGQGTLPDQGMCEDQCDWGPAPNSRSANERTWAPPAAHGMAWDSEDEHWLQASSQPADAWSLVVQDPEAWQLWTEEDEMWWRGCLLYPPDHEYYQDPFSGHVEDWFDVEGGGWPWEANPRDWNEQWQWPPEGDAEKAWERPHPEDEAKPVDEASWHVGSHNI